MEIKIKFTQYRIAYTEEEVTGVLNVSEEELAEFGFNEKTDKNKVFDTIDKYCDTLGRINSSDFTELEVKTIRTWEDEDNPYDQGDFKVIE